MELDWLHKVLVTLLMVTGVGFWVCGSGWEQAAREKELVILEVKEWQVRKFIVHHWLLEEDERKYGNEEEAKIQEEQEIQEADHVGVTRFKVEGWFAAQMDESDWEAYEPGVDTD